MPLVFLSVLSLVACSGPGEPSVAPAPAPPAAVPPAPEPAAPEPAAPPEPPEPPTAHDWPAACPDPTDPGIRYEHATWAERDLCQRIRFHCDIGWSYFGSPECGCGCEKAE